MVSIPAAGYPSKRAAIWAMLDQNKSHAEIAKLVDTSVHQVYIEASSKRGHEKRHLPPDLRVKAQRIYYESLKTIGAALGIEPYILHDVYRKLLFKDFDALKRAEQSTTALERHEAATIDVKPDGKLHGEKSSMWWLDDPHKPETVGPGEGKNPKEPLTTRLHPEIPTMAEVAGVIAKDNRELVEKEIFTTPVAPAQESPEEDDEPFVAPPKSPRRPFIEPTTGAPKWVTLVDPDTGEYLNLDGSGVVATRQYAYKGTPKQARAMRDASTLARKMSIKAY